VTSALTLNFRIEENRRAFDCAAEFLRLARRTGMLRKTGKLLALVCAGAALFAANSATAQTVVMYFGPSHLMTGWVIYANDGHICDQWGSIGGTMSTYEVPGDCT
jgi:hypothetical protein